MNKIAILAAAAALTACTATQPKVLVLYYSQTGATRTVAERFAAELGADIEAFDVEQPYDGDFQETIDRCLSERENCFLPAIKPISSDIADYDIIFLGFPVWFGTCATPVQSLLKEMNFQGKTIVPFCTFGSGGLESSSDDLHTLMPEAEVLAGYGVRNARVSKAPEEISRFLIESGFKEGEVEALPEFSEIRNINAEDLMIFEQACGSYQMPLGSPSTVAERPVANGTEYLFDCLSQDMEGNTVRMKIYVVSIAGEDPEFTKVVR